MTVSDQIWRDIHAAVIAFMPASSLRVASEREETVLIATEKLVKYAERYGHSEFTPGYIRTVCKNAMVDALRRHQKKASRTVELYDMPEEKSADDSLHLWSLLAYAEPRDLVAARVIGRLIVGDDMATADREIRGPEWSNLPQTRARVQRIYLTWEQS